MNRANEAAQEFEGLRLGVRRRGDTMTGNLEISKADPTITLTDTGNSETSTWTRADTSNLFSVKNRIQSGAPTSYSVTTDGVSSTALYATTSDDFELQGQDFTLTYWLYRTSTADWGSVLTRDSNIQFPPFMMGWIETGVEKFYADDGSQTWAVVGGASKSMGNAQLNTWTKYTVTRIGNTFQTYQNDTPITSWTTQADFLASSANLAIGRYYGNFGGAYGLIGRIDGLKIYKGHGMSQAEVTADYAAGAGVLPAAGETFTANLIPKMTGASTPSGTASASSEYGGTYVAWWAFDKGYTYGWVSAQSVNPEWLKYDFGTAKTISSYWIDEVNAAYATAEPNTWTFEGSNDDINWTTLDTQTSITWGRERKYFTIGSPGSYRYYRIYITVGNGQVYFGIPEMGMVGNSTTTLSAGYKFDENTGTTSADVSGNNHTMTMYGAAGWGASSVCLPAAGTMVEATILSSEDSTTVGEYGINYFGSALGNTIIRGNPIDFYINTTAVGGFNTSNDFFVDTNTLYVDASTNRIGIGTTTPTGVLEIRTGIGTDAEQPKFFSASTTASQWNEWMFGAAEANYRTTLFRYYNGQGTAATAKLWMGHYGNDPETGNGITLTGDGLVGINIFSPTRSFSVNAATNVYSSLNVGGAEKWLTGCEGGTGRYLIFGGDGITQNYRLTISTAGVVDIPGSLTVTGATTASSFVIGANTLDTNEWAYLDGQDQTVKTISSPTFAAVSGGNLFSTGSVVSFNRLLSPIGTGSPTTWGKASQAGNFITDAGSQLWVAFGTPFSTTPFITVSALGTDTNVYVNTAVAGSFQVMTSAASTSGNYIAIGG